MPSPQLPDLAAASTKPAPGAEPQGTLPVVRPAVPGPPRWREAASVLPYRLPPWPSTRQREPGCSASLPPDISPSWILKTAFQQRARCLVPPSRPSRNNEGPPPRLVPAAAPKDLSDNFSRLLDEMDEILGEPTIALLIRLGWLAPDRQKDHAAVVRGLTRFVGHLLDMTRNARP